jgi:site-specific recombinase XerD
MEKQYIISIVLDLRRKKNNSKYPVKVRLYHSPTRVARLYSTKHSMTTDEFDGAWKTLKTPKECKENKVKLRTLEVNVNDIADKLRVFSFEAFERKYLRKFGDGQDVFYHYEQIIKRLKSNNQIGTAGTYKNSKESIEYFLEKWKGSKPSKLSFFDITPAWLNKYEHVMLNRTKKVKVKQDGRGRPKKPVEWEIVPFPMTRTTISIYMRALRTVFNTAIAENDIDVEVYPFGKRKYQLPAVQGVKKALTSDQINTLYFASPKGMEQEKARDFWFFSYACNGINLKDIAELRWEDLQEETIIFYRAKTINTGKTHLKPVTVYITDPVKHVIEKYGNTDKNPKKLIFSILSEDQDETTKFLRVKNFTRFVNQHLKKLASANGITTDISSYWARHSFATNAIRHGASMEFVSESLNHSNLRTTQGYFAGFESEAKKELMKNLMIFTKPGEVKPVVNPETPPTVNGNQQKGELHIVEKA